jgi:phosphoribosylanthranilate isomerase
MTWVKICGITNLEDALTAVEAGADALGFVFYEKSPRNIDAEAVGAISEKLPGHIERVGVFVGDPGEKLLDLAWRGQLSAFQFQMVFGNGKGVSENTGSKASGLGVFPKRPKFFVALPAALVIDGSVKINLSLPESVSRPEGLYDTVFLDSGTPTEPGGTGVQFNWRAAAQAVADLKEQVKVVIAGGLNPTNVSEAIGLLHPWGVDVSSGVEARPGKKDPEKVRAFIKAVREADKGNSN